MNKILSNFARSWLKEHLRQRPEKEQHFFKRMYSHKHLDRSIEDVVNAMPDDKLDWAMQQVQNSENKQAA